MVDQGENVRGQILALVREFVRREVAPQAAAHDRDDTYPHKLVKQMTELGLFGIAVPEEYGGLGLDHTTFAMIFEELSKGWMSITGVLGTHSILTYALARFGTTEQKRRWLPRLASGEMRGALAMTEPNAGSDVAAIQTVAVREGDEYVVNGRKLFITNGRHCHAALVMVKTDPDARPAHRGISALVVEKGPGFTVGPNMEKLGYRGVDTCELIFDNCRVPAENLVGCGRARGFVRSWRRWRPDESTSPPAPWASRRRPSKRPSATPSVGAPLASPSPNTRQSRRCWRTWRRRFTPPAC